MGIITPNIKKVEEKQTLEDFNANDFPAPAVEPVLEDTPEYAPKVPVDTSGSGTLENYSIGRQVASDDTSKMADKYMQDFPAPEADVLAQKEAKNLENESKNNFLVDAAKDTASFGLSVVAGGVLDAAENTVNAVIDVADFLDNQMGLDAIPEGMQLDIAQKLVPKGEGIVENVARSAVSFLVPFGAISKATKGMKLGGAIIKSGSIGMAADFLSFDTEEKNLSNLIQNTALANPITEYLATDIDDTNIEKRFKTALEGAGLGVMMEGIFRGVKAYKTRRAYKLADEGVESAKNLPVVADEADEVAQSVIDAPPPVPTTVDELPPVLRDSMFARKQLKDYKIGELPPIIKEHSEAMHLHYKQRVAKGDRAVNIDLSKVKSSEDVRKTIKATADTFKGQVNEARRGVVTVQETEKLAAALDMTPEDLMNRATGQAVNAETMMASRQLLNDSASDLVGLSKSYRSGDIGLDTYLAAWDKHVKVQSEVHGMVAEAGRTLNILKQEVGGSTGLARMKKLEDLHKAFGQDPDNLAEKIINLSPDDINKVARRSLTTNLFDAALEVRVNGLLSSPRTFMTNLVSNTGTTALAGLETGVARGVSILRGSDAYKGEAPAMLNGLLSAQRDGFILAKKVFMTGVPSDASSKMIDFIQPAISAEKLGFGGTAMDVFGSMIRLPGRGLTATDEYFKSINMRMFLSAEAHKKVVREGLSGEAAEKAINKFINKPPKEAIDYAMNQARYNTFTQPLTGMSHYVERSLREMPGGRVLFPFIRTNMNIARYGVERLPGMNAILPEVRSAWKAGGAARDMVIARSAVGGSAMTMAGMLANEGILTGAAPGDNASKKMWMQAGNKPYAVKIGDTYLEYNRLDPLGAILGIGADAATILGMVEDDKVQEVDEIVSAMAVAAGHFFTPEFLVDNVGGLLDIVRKGDARAVERLVTQFPATFIPYGSALREGRKWADPAMRETMPGKDITGFNDYFEKTLNQVKNIIPGLSDSLPPRRNLFGEVINYPMGGTPAVVSPIAVSKGKTDPAWKEIVRLGLASPAINSERGLGQDPLRIQMPPKVLNKSVAGQSIPTKLSSEQYDKLVQLSAGIGLKHSPVRGKTLKQALNTEIKNGYPSVRAGYGKEVPDMARKLAIKSLIGAYRKSAQAQLMTEENLFDSIKDSSIQLMEMFRGK